MSKSFLHEHHSFLDPSLRNDPRAKLAELVYDMAEGLGLALELIHSSNFDQSALPDSPDNPCPILSEPDTYRLMRFVIASTNLLKARADDEIELMNEIAGREGKA
jgi:hypothetical protein